MKFIYDKKDSSLSTNSNDIIFLEKTHQIYTHGKYFPDFTKSEAIDIIYSKSITKNITTSWSDLLNFTDIDSSFELGTYTIQVTYSNNIFSGIFSYNGVGGEEIILHQAGDGTRIFLKTNNGKLQIVGNSAVANASLIIKLRKIL